MLVQLTQDDAREKVEGEAQLWVEPDMTFGDLHAGAKRPFHVGDYVHSKALWQAGYPGQGHIQVRIE